MKLKSILKALDKEGIVYKMEEVRQFGGDEIIYHKYIAKVGDDYIDFSIDTRNKSMYRDEVDAIYCGNVRRVNDISRDLFYGSFAHTIKEAIRHLMRGKDE